MDEPHGIYLTLKLAAKLYRKLYSKLLEVLTADELRRVKTVAAKQYEIETLILTTPEAASVMLPETSIEASLMEIRERYASALRRLCRIITVRQGIGDCANES